MTKTNAHHGVLRKCGYLLTHKDNVQRGQVNLDICIWQEKQYNIIDNLVLPNENTFSEYLYSVRLKIFNRLYRVENLTAPTKVLANKGQTEVIEHL
ncbi:MAG: hypothetical protein IPN86_18915 [Saprospiraceae bacterium]|nr:hypothetical protein [Saprospiraceae bacterium]